MRGTPLTPLPLPLAPQGARLLPDFIRNKQECVTPVYYTGVIALRADFDLAVDLVFCPVTGAALVGLTASRGWPGEVLRLVPWEICQVPWRGLDFQSEDGGIRFWDLLGAETGGFAWKNTGYFASDLGFPLGLLLLLILNETIHGTKSDLDRGLNRCVA